MAVLDDFVFEYEKAKALHPDLDLDGDSITFTTNPLRKLETAETDSFRLAQFETNGWIKRVINSPVWELTASGESQLVAQSVFP